MLAGLTCQARRTSHQCLPYLAALHGWAAQAASMSAQPTLLKRALSSALQQQLLQFCIVGSGPAGFYTADADRLPTPFGLVRSGVAPDHPETKNVEHQFTQIAQHPQVGFFGNVMVGRDVSVQQLRSLYSAVIMAYGAESSNSLDIPGQGAPNILTAREFVWWYNGHPDHAQLPIDLSTTRSVAVLGLGNVAVDCARILLQPAERLARTDVAEHALQQLRRSTVQEVHLIGRRGPVQAAFTPKELREVLQMEGIHVHIDPEQLVLSAADQVELKSMRIKRRAMDILKQALSAQPVDRQHARHLHLHFLRSPTAFLTGPGGELSGVRLEHTKLAPPGPDGRQQATGTGRHEELPSQLVLQSIGYRSEALQGVPFDARAGMIPNRCMAAWDDQNVRRFCCARAGRVLKTAGSSEVDAGLYAVGWVKRGPTGIIGTNLVDAQETVNSIVQDAAQLQQTTLGSAGGQGLQQLLAEQGTRPVHFAEWQRINQQEQQQGKAAGRPRQKIVHVPDLLQTAFEQGQKATLSTGIEHQG